MKRVSCVSFVIVAAMACACGKKDGAEGAGPGTAAGGTGTGSAGAVAAGGPSDADCAAIKADPPKAMADLAKRMAPVEVAATIERCVAPTGDECARIEALVTAIPSFVPALGPAPDKAAETCRGAPPEMRKCMLPSYVLANQAECTAMLEKLRDTSMATIDIGRDPGRGTAGCKPQVDLAIEVRPDGARIKPAAGTAWKGPIAADQLKDELTRAVAGCAGVATVLAKDETSYQQVVSVMDAAVAAGLDVALDTGKTKPTATPDPAAPAAPGTKDDLQSAPVVAITKTEVRLDGILVVPVTAKDLAAKLAPIMRERQKAKPGRMLVLQADEATTAMVLNQVVHTAKAAGFDNILFAVKNKSTP